VAPHDRPFWFSSTKQVALPVAVCLTPLARSLSLSSPSFHRVREIGGEGRVQLFRLLGPPAAEGREARGEIVWEKGLCRIRSSSTLWAEHVGLVWVDEGKVWPQVRHNGCFSSLRAVRTESCRDSFLAGLSASDGGVVGSLLGEGQTMEQSVDDRGKRYRG
jgi:hypothetical protein